MAKKLSKIKFLIKAGFILAVFGMLSVGGIFAYYAKDLPSPASIHEMKITESTKIYDRTGEVLLYDIHGEQKRTIISFQDMPAYIKYATIVAEDDEFYKHFGIDIKGIGRAMISNIQGQGVVQGGSTITQQLIKNIYLTPERTIARKIKELILAIEMEIKYSKDEILSFYLNIVPYGSNAYGLEAASQTFFNKHAKDLTLSEAALLASLPKAPTYYSPFGNNPEELKRRQEYILQRMQKSGYISEEELTKSKKETLDYAGESRGINAPHFIMYVKDYLEEKYGEDVLKSSGLKVATTLDWDLQREAESIVKKWAKKNEARFGARNAALVAIDPKTGQILAMVGSRDYFDKENDGNVNVTTRLRQPGSSFKPFAYAVAFDKGYTPDTIIFDAETNFGLQGTKEYIPQNYDEEFRGPISFKEALAQSINIPAVKVLYLAGVPETIKLAKSMGITSLNEPSRYGLSLVLGGGEVTLLDETSAYGVFSQDGTHNKVASVLKIISKNREVIEEFTPHPRKVLEPQIPRLINSILSDNELRAPMFGQNSYLNLEEIPAAAKTGTTQDYLDAWTIGYTPDIVVGVWVGNNNNDSKIYGAAGVKAAAPIWQEFMKKAYDIKKMIPKQFAEPKQIDKKTPPYALHALPSDDPQFVLWEESIKKWLDEHKEQPEEDAWRNAIFPSLSQEDNNNAQIKKSAPNLSITSPNANTFYNRSDTITLALNLQNVSPVTKIEIFFDNQIVKTASNINIQNQELSVSFKVPSALTKKENPHDITVRAFDEALNKGEASVNIIVY